MKLKTQDAGTVDVADAAFGAEFNEALVHQVVTAFLAGGRAGTKAQKNRAAVQGGGAKPWRQKGTGRARSGSNTSPIWEGGGVVFGPKPRDYHSNVPKKMKRNALLSMLTDKASSEKLMVVDLPELEKVRGREVQRGSDPGS